MQSKNTPPPAPAFALSDVYHIVFRHKWKIVSIWALGIIGAIGAYCVRPVPYRSQAELFIPYVLESKSPHVAGSDTAIKNADEGGQSILNSEVEILNSFDLALEVAEMVGPEKILAKVGGGGDRFAAANWIRNGLVVEAPRRSTVIRVVYQHPDKAVVQVVLRQLIESYLKKHVAIHQSGREIDDLLRRQTEQGRIELLATEESLRKAKQAAGVDDLAEAKKTYADQLNNLNTSLFAAEVELAELQGALGQMTSSEPATNASANAAETNVVAGTPPTVEITEQYRQILADLNSAIQKEQGYRDQHLISTNDFVRIVRQRIVEGRKAKEQLEKDYPQLTGIRPEAGGPPALTPLVVAGPDIPAERGKIAGVQGKIAQLKQQIATVKQRNIALSDAEREISDLQRIRDIQAKNYMDSSTKLESAHIEDALGTSRTIPNIKPIELPTPPGKDPSKLYKLIGMLLAGAFGGGIAVAFVFELFLDQSFKRPEEVKARLSLPLFLSIPLTHFRETLPPNGPATKLLTQGTVEYTDEQAEQSLSIPAMEETAPWRPEHELHAFFETLRDRLVLNFELRKLTHNPKLIAITSCGKDAGVSTIASGLAASLSETGEGNVLLVNMNDAHNGAAHYFRNGKLECGLDDALQAETRNGAQVKNNLYVAEMTENENVPQLLHKRFSSLLPKLKSSDYDYIIFDMPPVNQTSPTPRLARFMDMVLMVVEAEKTDRNVVKRATDLIEESKGTVGIVLNKTRNYVPAQLQPQV